MRSPQTPTPPYYAVIFTSTRTSSEQDAYFRTAQRMDALAAQQPGYLGHISTQNDFGQNVTISYWQSLQHIADWKTHPEHVLAQSKGKSVWYSDYKLEVCRVETAHTFKLPTP